MKCDVQICLDLAHDYARAGFHAEAVELSKLALLYPRKVLARFHSYIMRSAGLKTAAATMRWH